jgi:hypothetical protein
MAGKHPYVSGNGVLTQVLDHLRKSFPATLNADVLKKLGFAPKNESYIINTLRFLDLIKEDGSRTPEAQKVFVIHEDEAFQAAFSEMVKDAYSDLFSLHGDGAWDLDQHKLITFFRQTDQSSALVGGRQAGTFRALGAYAGKVDASSTSSQTVRPAAKPTIRKKSTKKSTLADAAGSVGAAADAKSDRHSLAVGGNVGLTVRVEINLPATGDQGTYDKIFRSIRENLLNG